MEYDRLMGNIRKELGRLYICQALIVVLLNLVYCVDLKDILVYIIKFATQSR